MGPDESAGLPERGACRGTSSRPHRRRRSRRGSARPGSMSRGHERTNRRRLSSVPSEPVRALLLGSMSRGHERTNRRRLSSVPSEPVRALLLGVQVSGARTHQPAPPFIGPVRAGPRPLAGGPGLGSAAGPPRPSGTPHRATAGSERVRAGFPNGEAMLGTGAPSRESRGQSGSCAHPAPSIRATSRALRRYSKGKERTKSCPFHSSPAPPSA